MTVDKEAILNEKYYVQNRPEDRILIDKELILEAMDEYAASLLKENEELKEALTNTEKAYEIMRDKLEYWKARCEAAEKYINLINSDCGSEEEIEAQEKWQALKQQPIK